MAIDGHIEPRDEMIRQLHGKTFPNLPAEWRRSVASQYTIRKIVLHEVSAVESSEIFQRLNMGTRMEPAELRNSLIGPIRDFVKNQLAKHKLFSPSLIGIRDNNRLNYHDLAAKMLFFVKNNGLDSAPNARNLLEWYRDQRELSNQQKDSVLRTLDFLAAGLEAHNGMRFNVAVLLSTFWVAFKIRRDFQLGGSSADFMEVIKEFEAWRTREKAKKARGEKIELKADQFNEAVRAHTTDAESFKLRDSILQETIAENLRLVSRDSRRTFSESQKQEIYSRDKGICYFCEQHVQPDDYEAHHIFEWSSGGLTATEHGACSHRSCNRKRTFVGPPKRGEADDRPN